MKENLDTLTSCNRFLSFLKKYIVCIHDDVSYSLLSLISLQNLIKMGHGKANFVFLFEEKNRSISLQRKNRFWGCCRITTLMSSCLEYKSIDSGFSLYIYFKQQFFHLSDFLTNIYIFITLIMVFLFNCTMYSEH